MEIYINMLKYYKKYSKESIMVLISVIIIGAGDIILPMASRVIINEYIPNGDQVSLLQLSAVMVVVYIIVCFCKYIMGYVGHIVGTRIEGEMRREAFEKLQRLQHSYYDNHKTGQIMARLTNELHDVGEVAHHGPEFMLTALVALVGGFIFLSTINLTVTLILFGTVFGLILVVSGIRKRNNSLFKVANQKMADVFSKLESSISSVRLTKAFLNEDYEIEKFEGVNEGYIEAGIRKSQYIGVFMSMGNLITYMMNLMILAIGGWFTIQGTLAIGDLVAFTMYFNLIAAPLRMIINFEEMYQKGLASYKRFEEFMNQPELIVEKEGAIELNEVSGNIEFDNVTFEYLNGQKALDDVSFIVKPGEKIALVGESGAGKTTIANIVPRFYDVTSGEVKIDGVDLRDLTMRSIRDNIAYIQQNVEIFYGTIKENVAYGKIGATDEEIIEACKKAKIHDFIMSMENGYNTIVGERGVRLSGGQKQRVSIARIFLRDPKILILDEATSALDNITERLIQESLDELAEGRTVITIAHRLSTIKNADRIILLEDGKILETGNPQELISKDTYYKRLHDAQYA